MLPRSKKGPSWKDGDPTPGPSTGPPTPLPVKAKKIKEQDQDPQEQDSSDADWLKRRTKSTLDASEERAFEQSDQESDEDVDKSMVRLRNDCPFPFDMLKLRPGRRA